MKKKQIIDEILDSYKESKARSDLKVQNAELVKEVERLQNIIEVYNGIKSPRKELIIKPYERNGVDEAVALTLHSDSHIEKRIDKSETNGLNFYNPDEAARRIITHFHNLIKILSKQKDVKIHHLIVGLLGDIIHGFIHEEYISSNYMTPIEATIYAYDVYTKAFSLLSELNLKEITVVCKVGNHSRTTKKVYVSSELKHSYEYQLYSLLSQKFTEYKWIIEENYNTYFKVYDKVIRAHHGHAFSYVGGIGGIYPSMLRWIAKQNETQVADLDIMGHWHTPIWVGNVLVNNSVCGADAYSLRKGFKAYPPSQQLLLIDKKRGFTVNYPIILT